jgi:hypothetical protein
VRRRSCRCCSSCLFIIITRWYWSCFRSSCCRRSCSCCFISFSFL